MRFTVLALALTLGNPALAGGFVESACLSKRGDHPVFCACTQDAANRTLSLDDQQTAAQMIVQPDMYYDWAESGKRAKQAFIDRYEVWGDKVQELCSLEG